LFGTIRQKLGRIFHELARQKECQIVEGQVMPDHVHMCVQIPPKFAVASIVGFLKGKSAIAIAREFAGKDGTSRGSISGLASFNLEQVKSYIRAQEADDEQGASNSEAFPAH
jgi:putative transposase